jgi:type VI secretion system secreted protein VgrG
MPYTQAHRHLAFASPLGDDVLLLRQLRGQEGISRLFHFDLELLSEDPAVDFTAVIGKNVTIRIQQADHTDRFLNGIVSRFSQGSSSVAAGSSPTLTTYHAEVVPWLWMLTRTADCKIFQMMTAPDIIQAIFATYGLSSFRLNLQATYPVREYSVQYRETDFNFVSRLMEQYGIFYYFEHANGTHTLVLADANAAFDPCPGQSQARYQTTLGATRADEDVVTGWTQEQEMRPAKYSLMDFNFETPPVNLQVNVDSVLPPPGGMAFEIYDYPGDYLVQDVGNSLATVRIEEEETQSVLTSGSSNCRPFVSGYTFDLLEHPRADLNQTYILTSIQHAASQSYEAGDPGGGFSYTNQFTCVPLSIRFRPVRLTPKPVIHGLQTAIVAGVAGEEIYVDSYGRIKVQFHWDRFGQRDENSSCWIRVAQNWAGKRWGFVFLPRIGQEVLVGFLEGDPDQPMITGCVYNGDQIQPYDLPDYQTRSVIRTDTTPGGGKCNEIHFEDQAGVEEFYMHASREFNIHVKVDRHETVEGERHLEVYKDKHEAVGQTSYLKVSGDHVADIGQDLSRKIGGDLILDVGGSHAEKAGQEIYLKAGMNVVIEAGMEITLKASGGFVTIGPSGVTIQGTMVLINSGGAAGSGSAKSAKTVPDVIGVPPPDAGTPDFNIFMPSNVADPSDASGSTSCPPSAPDDGN